MKTKLNYICSIICLVILILILTGDLFAQINDRFELKFVWKKWDKNNLFTHDKFAHGFGGWILNNQFDKNNTVINSFLLTQLCSLAWEVKDGLIDFKEAGFWGGDGFDFQDHLWVTVGQLGQILMDHVFFKKPIYTRQKMNNQVKRYLNKELYK